MATNDWIALFGIEQGTLVGKNWTHLPTELKMKILESLPGVDIARVSCVCTENRNLASDNDLWKQKCSEEFADRVTEEADELFDWKDMFAGLWMQKRRERRRRRGWSCVSCNPTFEDDWFGARDWDGGSGSSVISVLNLW